MKHMGNINITDKAISKIQEVLASQGMKYFRIKVKGGGCSGFQYDFSFVEIPNDDDHIFNANGVSYLIDKVSMDFLKDSKLEYVSELSGSYFKIENPNATANCGCGTSFSI